MTGKIISPFKVNDTVTRRSISVGNIFMYQNGNGTRYASLGHYNGFHYGFKLSSVVNESGSFHTPVKATVTPMTSQTMDKSCQIVGFFTLDLKFNSIPEIRTFTKAMPPSFASLVSAPNFITRDGKAHMFVNLGPSVHGNGGIDLFSVTDGESFNHLPYDSLVAERGMAHIVTHEQKEKNA